MTKPIKLSLLLFALIAVIVACTSEQVPAPSNCIDPPSINLVSTTDAGCNLTNGSITVAGSGGEGNLIFSINGGSFQGSPTFTGLSAGTYTIEVTDADNCSSSLQATVENADGLNIAVTVVGTECGENQGSILLTPSDAQGVVEYKLNEGQFQSSNSFQGLGQGGYTVTARDESGCEIEQEVDVTSDVRFNDIQLIVQTNCAISGCHDGTQSPDFRNAGTIVSSATRIGVRTAARSMPPGGRTITNEQIEAIACWVTDGAPGN